MNRNYIEIDSKPTNKLVISNVCEEEMKLYNSAELNEELRDVSENSSLSLGTSILTSPPKFSTKSSLFLNKYKGFLAFTSPMNFWIGILMLFLMIVPCSIIGPLTVGLPAHDAYVKGSWRFQGCTILSVLILTIMYMLKCENLNYERDFSFQVLLRHSYLSIFTLSWATGYALGCSFTITSHADIMYCSSGVWIFLVTILICGTIHKFEVYGYLLYLIGVIFMFVDPFASKTWMDGQSYLGDLYAFLGAGACAIFTYLNKINDPGLHPMLMLTQMFVFCTIYQFIFFPFLSTSNNFFSMDPTMGAFGWLNDSYSLFLVMCVNAPITGILANVGFFSSFKYFPIQIVTGVMLIEPFFAQLTGILLGQDEVPGVCTLVGLIIITGAFVITGLGATYKTQDQLKMKENYEQIDLELSIIDNTK